jgi:hypothetical protein
LPAASAHEDVARQRDAGPGLADRRDHRRIGFVAVAQQRDAIAALGRAAGQASRGPVERGQMVGALDRRLLTVARAVPGPAGAQAMGAPGHPVDAEHQIQQRAQHRGEPGDADPADRAADVALAQQDMQRDGDRQQQMRLGEDLSAGMAEIVEQCAYLPRVSRPLMP